MAPIDVLSVLRAWLNPFNRIAVWLRIIRIEENGNDYYTRICPYWAIIAVIGICLALTS
jgi:hypothetical protein